MSSVAITGHRPEKIDDPEWVKAALTEVLQHLQPERLYQGMAAGVDLWSAVAAYRLGIAFIACRPWAGHAPRRDDAQLYAGALERAAEIVNVTPGSSYQGPWMYHKRNAYMVDHADIIIAVWDGAPGGGTAACVRYAQDRGKPIVRIDPTRQTVIYPPEIA